LVDERTGRKQDYSRMDGIVFSGVFAPKNTPAWASDREQLWNRVERREDESNRANSARLAREIRIALPHELTDQQRQWLVKDFVREQFVRKGMVADVNIHGPGAEGDERNHHAHILVTLRTINSEGFGLVNRNWNTKAQLNDWRAEWERLANKHLERHGHEERIDCRTLEAQGIDRQPTMHRGPHVDAIERRGLVADNSHENTARRDELGELRAALSNITRDIVAEQKERAAEVAPGLAEIGPGEIVGALSGFTAAVKDALKPLAILGALAGEDQPTPPPTKEAAEAQRQERMVQAMERLRNRERRRLQDNDNQKQIDPDRQRDEDDYGGRNRQRR
jgi:hypothetical protein